MLSCKKSNAFTASCWPTRNAFQTVVTKLEHTRETSIRAVKMDAEFESQA